MTALRTTVITKTDIVGSTSRTLTLSETELDTLLRQHKQLIVDVVVNHQGSIIKGEGDAFWIVFPSVTTAALAAIAMHQKLRLSQVGMGDERRLAIRVIITVGDVLHREHDLFGYAMSLTARIEGITPPDEIYLSHAAWLVLNKAEVPTSFVNVFTLKDVREPERVYRVEQKHRTRIVTDRVIVFTDIRSFTFLVKSRAIADVEDILIHCDEIANGACEQYGGIVRNVSGDGYLMTFSDTQQALKAVESIYQQWQSVVQRYGHDLGIGVHKGDIHILRSYIYSHDINMTVGLERLTSNDCAVLVSQRIKDEVAHTRWASRLRAPDWGALSDKQRAVVEACGAYQLIMHDE
jgi:class 3 adenylate cyclase